MRCSFDAVMKQLTVFEADVSKTYAVSAVTASRELAAYESNQRETESKITSVQAELISLKQTLALERVERAHREEYDAIAKSIHAFPTRQHTQKQIAAVQSEVNALEVESANTGRETNLKRKQFSSFVHALNDLKRAISTGANGTDSAATDTAMTPAPASNAVPIKSGSGAAATAAVSKSNSNAMTD